MELLEESKVLMTKSLRERVFEFLEKIPNANIIQLYDEFPNVNRGSLQQYKWYFRKMYKAKNLINWKKMKHLHDIFKFKAKVIKQLTREEVEAIDYFNKLVSENYKSTTKKR